jgi:hypothetical protein
MNALVSVPVRTAPVSHVSRGAIAQYTAGAFESALAELYTVHDSTAEDVAGLVYPELPWVIRHNGKYKTIMSPRYATQAEADCAAPGLNHTRKEPMNALTDRRSVLRGVLTAASVAAVPASVAAETLDPVFGLLEAHKAAWVRLLETENRTDDYYELEDAGRAADASLAALLATPPTTRAGARAVMTWLMEFEEGRVSETSGAYLATLLRSPVLTAV